MLLLLPCRFRLYISTRLRAPRFPFDVVRHCSLVNFSVTRAQLAELLVAVALKAENPELEQEHVILSRQKAKVHTRATCAASLMP